MTISHSKVVVQLYLKERIHNVKVIHLHIEWMEISVSWIVAIELLCSSLACILQIFWPIHLAFIKQNLP